MERSTNKSPTAGRLELTSVGSVASVLLLDFCQPDSPPSARILIRVFYGSWNCGLGVNLQLGLIIYAAGAVHSPAVMSLLQCLTNLI